MRHVIMRAVLGIGVLSTGLMSPVNAAMARGGGGSMHGMGGHGGPGMRGIDGGGRGAWRREVGGIPAYVLIAVEKISDPDKFKATMAGLGPALAAYSGHLALDADKPAAGEGAAAQHLMLLRFDSPERAEAWRQSDRFRTFGFDLRSTSAASIQFAPGLALAAGFTSDHGRGRRGFDMKAFEPFVKKNDALLGRVKGICTGC